MMDIRYGGNPADVGTASNARLRADYLVEGAFAPGALRLTYTHIDRMIVGGAVPLDAPLTLSDGADLGTAHFFSDREGGLANLGGAGRVTVDGVSHALANHDVLYIGRGARA
ncbi:MAG: 5-dehydro-4-deoxy-D-glucuronate isomerase, partial [Rhodobacteraceae bacterium]|nr:5-dehydro-4-deoxy-D-glucuronate isomerase [Paracoccaceae bacterium]